MAFFLSPIGNEQQFNANGDPLNAGRILTYLAGSTTPTATYTDNTGATQQANPIILNSLGLPASPIWLNGGITYKFVIQDANLVTLRTVDNISGINDTTATQTEWVSSGFVPTFISTVSFSVPGDQTGTLQIGRRLRTQNTAGLIYSRITNSVFAATITTVTVVNDSGVLDSGLSSVAYGLAAPISPSLPNSVAVRDTMGITTALQNQEGIAYTTAGTSTAYTLTPSPAITAYAAGQSFWVTFHTASGAAPTLAISGVATPPNLVYELSDGTLANIIANQIPAGSYRVVGVSATQYKVLGLPLLANVQTNGFRLTLTTGTPVTTADVASSSILYCTPYKGNEIALNTATGWVVRKSAEFSIALSGLASATPHDVFCYDNAGAPTLELLAWTNDTTRATAIDYLDGVLKKSGSNTRRYLGTIYTTSATTTADTFSTRYLWNYYNRTPRAMVVSGTNASWTYATASWRQAQGLTTNQLNFVVGVVEDAIPAGMATYVINSTATVRNIRVGIGYNSTTSPYQITPVASVDNAKNVPVSASGSSYPIAGKNFIAWLEFGGGADIQTFFGGTDGGIFGTVMA